MPTWQHCLGEPEIVANTPLAQGIPLATAPEEKKE
jgi:hypothetical protein